MAPLRSVCVALVLLALQPAAAAADRPFSFGFGFGPNHQGALAVAARPGGDRLLVQDSEYGTVLTAHRLVPGSRSAGPARELDARRGSASIVDTLALTYNPRAREYLLVYYWWSGAGNIRTELLALRIAPDGTPRGQPVPVSHGQASGLEPSAPEVLYDPATGGYLVAWNAEARSGSVPRTLYTQRLDRSARPASSRDTRIGPVGTTASRRVVRDATDGTFLVVRIEPGSKRELVTRRLDRGGRALGGERNHGDVRSHDLRVAYSPRARRFVLALTASQTVDVRTLARGGRRLGAPRRITAPTKAPGVQVTGLEYAARTDRLLLTWSFVDDQFHQGYFMYPRGQRIRGDGRAFAGRRLSFGTAGPDQPSGGTLATYDRGSGRHLVLWVERDPDLDAPAFFGQLIDG